MPRDGTATRKTILESALALLREGGLPAFSVERVAVRADVAKGLVLYHYKSRAGLIGLCGKRLERERADRLAAAVASRTGISAVDGLWDELLRQQDDGTARGWLSLAAIGAVTGAPDDDLIAQARSALLDGCTTALATGADRATLREAYEALALALLRMDA